MDKHNPMGQHLQEYLPEQLQEYLQATEYIDFTHPQVSAKAKQLAQSGVEKLDIAKRCFEFVRDEIRHSNDYFINEVSIKASEVLMLKAGICYPKSHLLAALLRANGIPTALQYQRLQDGEGQYCLHGLNAIWLDDFNIWYRVDARGNKVGVEADFIPPTERLAFEVTADGEMDSSRLFSEPLKAVVDSMVKADTIDELSVSLPDGQRI